MKVPYLSTPITEAETPELDKMLKGGWCKLGRLLKGCEDELLVRKLIVLEHRTRCRDIVLGNLLGRLRSLERKRILDQLIKRGNRK